MLTMLETRVLDAIREYIDRHGVSPTISELAEALDHRSRGTVHRYVQSLIKKGQLVREGKGWRGLRLAATPADAIAQLPNALLPNAPVSGASVSGASVSGASVSGASVSGASVSGAPVSGSPVSGSPVSGSPVSGSATSGLPSHGSPDFGRALPAVHSNAIANVVSIGAANPAGASASDSAADGAINSPIDGASQGLQALPFFISTDTTGADVPENFLIPLLGSVAAGMPIEAIPDETHLDLAAFFIGPDKYALRVTGDSMIDAGIMDGDTVILRNQSKARSGEIVVALIDGQEATLKRLGVYTSDIVELIPENSAMSPMRYSPARVAIQGVLIGQLRSY